MNGTKIKPPTTIPATAFGGKDFFDALVSFDLLVNVVSVVSGDGVDPGEDSE